MKYKTRFVVQNEKGFPFPVDMLRYDRCSPVDSQDASVLAANINPGEARAGDAVELLVYHESRIMPITPDRWMSFGWRVMLNGQDAPKTERI
jgi:hypothetical protein